MSGELDVDGSSFQSLRSPVISNWFMKCTFIRVSKRRTSYDILGHGVLVVLASQVTDNVLNVDWKNGCVKGT